MKRALVVFVSSLVAAGVAIAAVTRQDAAAPPTSASLMPAYVQAAKYWNARLPVSAIGSPPMTASLMPAYVQAYSQGRAPTLQVASPRRSAGTSVPTTASLMGAYVDAARMWRR